MLRRAFLASTFALALSGCVSGDNAMSLQTMNSLRLVDVVVLIPPEVHLNYTKAEDEFAASRGVSPDDIAQVATLARTPEGVAFIQDKARTRMQAAMRPILAPLLNGARPVRLEVMIRGIDVPGMARSVLAGGSALLQARLRLVDVASGQVYSELPTQTVSATRAGGVVGSLVQGAMEDAGEVREPYLRLCENLAQEYAAWLRGSARTGA